MRKTSTNDPIFIFIFTSFSQTSLVSFLKTWNDEITIYYHSLVDKIGSTVGFFFLIPVNFLKKNV